MAFVVPQLEPHVYGRYHFGAYKFAVAMPDPAGNLPGTGVVILRGAVSPDPMWKPSPLPGSGLIKLFTLPPGLRPAEARWLTCEDSIYLGLYESKPKLCVVFPNGSVWIKGGISRDGAIFFDGVSFVAEGPAKGLKARKAAGRARKAR